MSAACAGSPTPTPRSAPAWRCGAGNAVAGLILASLVAGLATTPYAAFHFHRLAPYGVIANLLAMPIVSIWVMPTGLLGLIAIPFGFDGTLWRLMGEGIGWMMAVALWVASLPGAVGRMPAFGIGPLLVCTAGLVVVCLLKTPLRWCGAALIALAAVLAIRTPQPDVLVAANGQALAVRGGDGRLAVLRIGGDAFTVREWLAADGDARVPNDKALREAMVCDAAGCIAKLADGKAVAYVTRRTLSRRIAAAPRWWSRRAKRRRIAPPPRSTAMCLAPMARWRCGGTASAGRSRWPGRPARTDPGRALCSSQWRSRNLHQPHARSHAMPRRGRKI